MRKIVQDFWKDESGMGTVEINSDSNKIIGWYKIPDLPA